MMNLHPKIVEPEQVEDLKAIAAKPDNFFTGYLRGFLTPDGEEYWIDTRYDADLLRAGLISEQD